MASGYALWLAIVLVFQLSSVVYVSGQGLSQLPLVPGLLPDASLEAPPDEPDALQFRLAHVFHHGTGRYPDLHRKMDVDPTASVWIAGDDDDVTGSRGPTPMPPLHAKRQRVEVHRLVDRSREHIDDLLETARWFGKAVDLPASDWTVDQISAPNITDKKTVLTMARAAANAYVELPNSGEWKDVKGGFNYTEDFGWEKDGIRGHIFADTKNSTVLIGLKGTSMAIFDGAETTTNDKINDNLFFGCCCGQGSVLTTKACNCQTATFECNSTCVRTALKEKNRYYYAAKDVYHNVTELYPDADIWFAGHSLGGATVSLVAMTFGLPAVTFEAPGEAMAASRLGLPTPPGYRVGSSGSPLPSAASYHFGHNADSLYVGQCGSLCAFAGYAMESQCHAGYECVYNTTGDLGWPLGLSSHRIEYVLHEVLEHYNETAKCYVVEDCNDCFNWKYFESNSSSTTTTTSKPSTSYTQTRTATCKTPGWWGCLDESTSTTLPTTTTTTTTATTTSTTSTTTCKTPGWFGRCNDATTTTTSTTTTKTTGSQLTASPLTPKSVQALRKAPETVSATRP